MWISENSTESKRHTWEGLPLPEASLRAQGLTRPHSQGSLPTAPTLTNIGLATPSLEQVHQPVHQPPAQIPYSDYTPGFPMLGFSICSNIFPQENLSLIISSEIVSTTLPLLAGYIFLQVTYIMCLLMY